MGIFESVMKIGFNIILILIVAVTSNGCMGKDEPAAATVDLACTTAPGCTVSVTKGSCTLSTGYCVDYTGSMYAATSIQTNTCTGDGTAFSTSPCATANTVGICKSKTGSSAEYVTRYYTTSPLTADDVQKTCTGACKVYCAP